MKAELPILNVKIINGCNLACRGCSHLSQYASPDSRIDLDSLLEDLKIFNKKIKLTHHISLLGGEPFLEPRWSEFLSEVEKIFTCQIRFYTNGLLIHKNIDKIIMHMKRGTKFRCSMHEAPHTSRGALILKNINLLKEEAKKHNLNLPNMMEGDTWNIPDHISYSINFKELWGNANIEKDGKLYPHNSDNFKKSYQNGCFCPNPQLYRGRLYKCAQTAYIRDILKTTNQSNSKEWKPYLKYNGVDLKDSLNNFCKAQYQPSWFCTQCPSFNNTVPRIQEPKTIKRNV
tara:strand:- start:7986 stop:8846 length:861 start_codon:yes stop_codon:yes gene_type:complete